MNYAKLSVCAFELLLLIARIDWGYLSAYSWVFCCLHIVKLNFNFVCSYEVLKLYLLNIRQVMLFIKDDFCRFK